MRLDFAEQHTPCRSVVQTFENRGGKLVEISKLQTEHERRSTEGDQQRETFQKFDRKDQPQTIDKLSHC